MPGHRSLAWIVPPLLIAVALPAVASSAGGSPPEWGVVRGAAAGLAWDAGEAGASRWSLADLPTCVESLATSAVVGGGGDVPPSATDPARFRLAGTLAADGALTGWDLTASAAGHAVRLALPPESAVRGPVRGWLAVASDDGTESAIRLVSAAAGCGRVVHLSKDVVRQAIIAPDGASVLFHAVGRADRADRGVWRMELGSSPSLSWLVPPLTDGDPIREGIGLIWATQLRLAHHGRLLAVESCGAADCRVRIAGSASRPPLPPKTYAGRVVGLDARHLVTLRDCDGATCSLVATDLVSGRERSLAGAVTSASTVVLDGRLLVAATTLGPDTPAFGVIDPDTGQAWPAARGRPSGHPGILITEDLRLISPDGTLDAGAEMPAGTAAGMAGPDPSLVVIDIAGLVSGDPGEVSR